MVSRISAYILVNERLSRFCQTAITKMSQREGVELSSKLCALLDIPP